MSGLLKSLKSFQTLLLFKTLRTFRAKSSKKTVFLTFLFDWFAFESAKIHTIKAPIVGQTQIYSWLKRETAKRDECSAIFAKLLRLGRRTLFSRTFIGRTRALDCHQRLAETSRASGASVCRLRAGRLSDRQLATSFIRVRSVFRARNGSASSPISRR